MRLASLLADVHPTAVEGSLDREIRGIAVHSAQVASEDLFVAIPGFTHDGHDFVPEAIARGARGIVVQAPVAVPAGVTCIVVSNTRLALGLLSSAFFGRPSQALRLIGVTGTNGKGTTAHLIEASLQASGRRCGLIGTIGAKVGDEFLALARTTPEAHELQGLLRRMVDAHCPYAVMEVASHALALHRVAGCRFHLAVFTNLTQDHLDFHKTFDEYRATKRRLFELVEPDGVSVVNADDPEAASMRAASRAPVLTYGIDHPADVRAKDIRLALRRTQFVLSTPAGQRAVTTRLHGRFNVANILAAVAVAHSQGVPLDVVADAVEHFAGVPGRFELIEEGQRFAVVVDYAHTPDGLANVLRASADVVGGRIIVVFGCGGDRDRTKRPIMGRFAVTLADEVIVTSDNPRTEEPSAIIAEVLAGMEEGAVAPASIRSDGRGRRPGRVQVEPDRRKAIFQAIALAGADDLVMIAGKGHEPYQEIRGVRYPFDDRVVAREALRQRREVTSPSPRRSR